MAHPGNDIDGVGRSCGEEGKSNNASALTQLYCQCNTVIH